MNESSRNSGLVRSIGFYQLFTLGFGAIVGVAWIILVGSWIADSGSLGAVIAFVLGTVPVAMIALCYAEAARLYPATGGEIVYAYELFGAGAAFATGWVLSLLYVAVAAFEAISVGWIVELMWPGIEGPVIYSVLGSEVRLGSLALGLAITAVLGLMGYRGASLTTAFQDFGTWLLLVVVLALVIAGIGFGANSNLEPLFVRAPQGSVLPGIVAVLATVPLFLGGFGVIPQAMGEVKERRSVRALLLFVVAGATLFYCLIILATAMVLPREHLLALELPAASAFQVAFDSPLIGRLVLFAGLLGILTTWNAMFFAATRAFYCMGRARLTHSWLAALHPVHRSPWVAVLCVTVLTALGALLARGFLLPVLSVSNTCLTLVYSIVSIGLLRRRLRSSGDSEPNGAPAFSTSGMLIACVCSVGLLGLSLYQMALDGNGGIPIGAWLLLGWTALGAVVWRCTARSRNAVDESQRRQWMRVEKV